MTFASRWHYLKRFAVACSTGVSPVRLLCNAQARRLCYMQPQTALIGFALAHQAQAVCITSQIRDAIQLASMPMTLIGELFRPVQSAGVGTQVLDPCVPLAPAVQSVLSDRSGLTPTSLPIPSCAASSSAWSCNRTRNDYVLTFGTTHRGPGRAPSTRRTGTNARKGRRHGAALSDVEHP